MKKEFKLSKKKILGLSAAMIMIFSALLSASACNCEQQKLIYPNTIKISDQQEIFRDIKNTGKTWMWRSLLSYDPNKEIKLAAGLVAKLDLMAGQFPECYGNSHEYDKTTWIYCDLTPDGGECNWESKRVSTLMWCEDSKNFAKASANGSVNLTTEATTSFINFSGNLIGDFFTFAHDWGPDYGIPCYDSEISSAAAKLCDYYPDQVEIPFVLAESCTMHLEVDLSVAGPNIIVPPDPPVVEVNHYAKVLWEIYGHNGVLIEQDSIEVSNIGEEHNSFEYELTVGNYHDFRLNVDVDYLHEAKSSANGCPDWSHGPNSIGSPPPVEHSYAVNVTFFGPSSCPADFDGDGDVDTADLLYLLGKWGTPYGDVDGDGDTDTADLLDLLAAWGQCP